MSYGKLGARDDDPQGERCGGAGAQGQGPLAPSALRGTGVGLIGAKLQ